MRRWDNNVCSSPRAKFRFTSVIRKLIVSPGTADERKPRMLIRTIPNSKPIGERSTLALIGHHWCGEDSIMDCFVHRRLPGDTINFRITEVTRNLREGSCKHYYPHRRIAWNRLVRFTLNAGGCPTSNDGIPSFPPRKVGHPGRDIAHGLRLDSIPMEPPLPSPIPYFYRNKMQLAVGKSESGIVLGLYRPGTHVIADMPSCVIQEETNNRLLHAIREGMSRCQWPPLRRNPKRAWSDTFWPVQS